MRVILLFVAALLIATSVTAQPDSLWSRTYRSAGDDYCFSLAQMADGGYALAGLARYHGQPDPGQVMLIRAGANGDSLWSREYGCDSADVCLSMQQTTDGGFVFAGYQTGADWTVYRMMMLRTDSNGDSLWSRTYLRGDNAFGTSVRQTLDGGYILAGCWGSIVNDEWTRDAWLVKTDANGDTLWTRSYGGAGEDEWRCVRQVSDGGYILAGYTSSYGQGGGDFWLMRTDANGDSLWSRAYGTTGYDVCYALQEMSDGGYLLAGYTALAAGNEDFLVVRTSSNGDALWNRKFGGPASDECVAITQTSDGGCILAGHTGVFTQNPAFMLVRLNSVGDSLWSLVRGSAATDLDCAVQQTPDGGFVFAASAPSADSTGFDFSLTKFAPELTTGNLQAPRDYGVLSSYPNPFNGSTTLHFSLPRAMPVSLRAFDVLGRQVSTIAQGNFTAGSHDVRWDCSNCASGVYVVSLSGNSFSHTRKVMLLK